MKTPEQIGREVIEANYGIGTEWEEPNQYGEEGFTRAQVESDIDADDVRLLIEQGINADREQRAGTESSASTQCSISSKEVVKQVFTRWATDVTPAWGMGQWTPAEDQFAEMAVEAIQIDRAQRSTSRVIAVPSAGLRMRAFSVRETYDILTELLATGYELDVIEFEDDARTA